MEPIETREHRGYTRGEVEEYDRYLTGQVYGFVVKDPAGESVESCWGFYGDDYAWQEATATADYLASHAIRTSPAWWVRMAAS